MKQRHDQLSIHDLVLDMHKCTARHVLVVEADLRQEDKVFIFGYAEKLRLLHNRVASVMNKKYEQLTRTRKFRYLLDMYKKAGSKGDTKLKEKIGQKIRDLRTEYGITFNTCYDVARSFYREYGVFAVFSFCTAENIWMGLEKILFEDGKKLNYKKRFDLPCIRARQRQKGILIKVVDGKLQFTLGKLKFNPVSNTDRFQTEELAAVIEYLENPVAIDEDCALLWKKTGRIPDTFRPCFATLKPQVIRGKLRVFIHINIEGKPLPKYDSKGNLRHKWGEGTVGVDGW